VIYSISCISTCFWRLYAHRQESWLHLNYCILFPALAIAGCSLGEWVVSHVHCGEKVARATSSPQCTRHTTTPETCWDTTDWINHYLLHLVGLAFDYLYMWVISEVLHTVCFLFKNEFILQNTFTGIQRNLHCASSQRSSDWVCLVFLSGRLRCWCVWLLRSPH
jgi:hypothetical protein